MFVINKNKEIFVYSAIAVFFAVFFLTYFPTIYLLHGYWSEMTEAYAHGYIMVVVTVYLLYERRGKIFRLDQEISKRYLIVGFLAVLGVSALWFVANVTQVLIIQFVCVVLLLWLWVAVVFGAVAAIHAALPIGLLFLAIPLWDGMGASLRNLTVIATQAGLDLFSINAFINGYFIQIPDGVIEVASSCSGLKYFLAGTSLAIIYAELNFSSIKRKLFVIMLGVVISLVANWVRVFSLVYIADATHMQSSLVHDHENFGWVVFAVSFTVFILILGRLDSGVKNEETLIERKQEHTSGNNYILNAFVVTLIAVMLPVLSWLLLTGSESNMLTHKFQSEQSRILGSSKWKPAYSGYDEMKAWRFQGKIDVIIMSYRKQEQGKELIYYRNKINKNYKNNQVMKVTDDVSVNVGWFRDENKPRLVVWYYKVGNYATNNENIAKLLQLVAILQGVPVASLVTVSVECKLDNCWYERSQLITPTFIEEIMNDVVIAKGEK